MPDLLIDKLTYGGAGLGRLNGKACFIPETAPGDIINVLITNEKKSYCEGEVERLISPSQFRSPPMCPLSGSCGGCNWQHISYSEQCHQKELIFEDILWRSARVAREKILGIVCATSQFHYRRRIQLKAHLSQNKLSLGFYRRATHSIVDISNSCEIAVHSLNYSIAAIREIISNFQEPQSIVQVDLASSLDNVVSCLFHYSGSRPDLLAQHLSNVSNLYPAIQAVSMQGRGRSSLQRIFGPETLRYTVPAALRDELVLHFSPTSFSQINFEQNRTIVQLIIDYCSTIMPNSILDLFCGNGNFSLPLAGYVRNIVGFETLQMSVQLAASNAAVNSIENARYYCKDSAAGLEQIIKSGERVDLVIMDPPRSGAADVSKLLGKSGVTHVVYISCDPPTLGRDLSILQNSGYEIVRVQPVDMFPQTYHLESIVFLKRSNNQEA